MKAISKNKIFSERNVKRFSARRRR